MALRKILPTIYPILLILIICGCDAIQQKVYSPAELSVPAGRPYILTPKPLAEPRINSAKVFGVRPGRSFLFTIAATGSRPITFAAENLPKGLALDKTTGRITGRIDKAGTYNVMLKAANSLGTAERNLKIVAGDKIALTPPMGWNSWNCWAAAVSDENVRQSAKAMADSGLINHGWTYINIDDVWQGLRGGEFNAIQPSEKFPDMHGLCDYVHSLGLKIGIYSTPWISSYAGYIGGTSDNKDGSWEYTAGYNNYHKNHRCGRYSFAKNDAQQWAKWGIDYLKYDWNPNDEKHVKEMAEALLASGRDIVYSLSNTAPFEHAAAWAELANCWRTTGDIQDAWGRDQLPRGRKWAWPITRIWEAHGKWAPFNGPGHYNDPDMLVIGKVGWGKKLHDTHLTPDEQYTHISLWCLWSAPLLLGCPLDKLDDFTLNLLTNDEVLAINQDPLCIQATRVASSEHGRVLAKKLEDGSLAVGLFNIGTETETVKVSFSELGIKGGHAVRDLWRQKDIGVYANSFAAEVRPHGVVLVRLIAADGK